VKQELELSCAIELRENVSTFGIEQASQLFTAKAEEYNPDKVEIKLQMICVLLNGRKKKEITTTHWASPLLKRYEGPSYLYPKAKRPQ
jgi:hypothetical protein